MAAIWGVKAAEVRTRITAELNPEPLSDQMQNGLWLFQILEETQKQGFQLIIVDDGSGKEAEGVFQKASVYGTVLKHPYNIIGEKEGRLKQGWLISDPIILQNTLWLPWMQTGSTAYQMPGNYAVSRRNIQIHSYLAAGVWERTLRLEVCLEIL